ncbi:hypothetical protein [Synechococcus elongatus]|uniref:Uncharacterized protein n=2 Tax=Synechococcus elongatus TaxID=32046 RepID=A0AAN1UT89_SYNEL|nr:hypothetical protein [Synechococcus elongatus]AZB71326.1 hypothetical protein DOP62_00030 [Synechococcus elongatus PCC 11801]QFZ90976.1 hypothetical protein EKO22_00030 [Synechococcus elongatus PCC 11802]
MTVLTLQLSNGSLSLPLSLATGLQLKSVLQQLLDQLRQASTPLSPGQRPTPQPSTDQRLNVGDISLEVFCNPNLWPSPFAAKVLLTVRQGELRLSLEVELSRLLEDLDQYLESIR